LRGLPEPLAQWLDEVETPEAFLLLNFLGELSRRVSAAYGSRLRSAGIDFSEYVVLWALRLAEPRLPSVSELRERVVMSSGGIALAIKRLEGKGLAARHVSAHDGRIVLVELTPKGRRLINELMAADLERHDRMLDGVSARGRTAILDALVTVLRRLD